MQVLSTTMLGSYFALLVFGTHWPWLPQQPDWVPVPTGFALGPDKIAHITAFAGLSLLLAFWMQSRAARLTWRHYGVVALVLALYAPLDELTQAWVPPRTPDVYDFYANLIGIGIGLAMFFLAERMGSRRFLTIEVDPT
ncbi:MAG: hypothetical protein DWQ31_01055 [Planctomycetota bacterium]|nr:MAG: hypothetical protein DWQ31_01055 [Planctomycetota bacterium]REJ92706.1 MAG: hypothetical protein DWQ35_11740 [Planctomycetota bacterium]REK23744.1 MAG: hypothetical protein DWQ42_14710 [Planctomycetota bacterium]REK47597.1 MAG: hypothetical protein DWQ46_03990 [Planctomycetota bacterium]